MDYRTFKYDKKYLEKVAEWHLSRTGKKLEVLDEYTFIYKGIERSEPLHVPASVLVGQYERIHKEIEKNSDSSNSENKNGFSSYVPVEEFIYQVFLIANRIIEQSHEFTMASEENIKKVIDDVVNTPAIKNLLIKK